MQNFQDIEHFVKTLSAAIKKKIPTKVSQLTNDAGYKTTDTNTTYKLSKSGSTVTLTGSDGSTTSVTDSNTTYSSLKNPYSLTIQNNGTTVASYDGSTAKTANFTNATTSTNGLMSAADKSKLDGIGAGANVKSVNGKTGAVTLSKADVGLGNVDNTSDLNKPISNAVRNELNSVYHIGGYYNSNSNDVGHILYNNTQRSIYKIKNFYAVSGEGDYFYLANKKSNYTITATKHFASVSALFTSNLSSDCFIRTDLCSETDPAILTIVSANVITATDVLTLLFLGHSGGNDLSRFNHWKLEILALYDSSKNWPNATATWKAGDWITVFERTNVSDTPNGLFCCLNPYKKNGVSYIFIKGIRLTIYAATPRSQKNGDFGYNAVPIGGLRLLDSRPSFSPAEALGALDISGGTVYGKTTFQEGIVGDVQGSASKVNGHTVNKDVPSDAKFTDTTYPVATSSTDGLMSKTDKAKLDGISSGAQANVIESVKVNGTALTPASKAVNVTITTGSGDGTISVNGTDIVIKNFSGKANKATTLAGYGIADAYTKSQTDSAIASAVASVFKYKGTKATASDLPSSGQTLGDTYFVTADSSEYAWNGTKWEELGPVIDLSHFITSISIAGITLSSSATSISKAQLKSALELGSAAYKNILTSTGTAPSDTDKVLPTMKKVQDSIAAAVADVLKDGDQLILDGGNSSTEIA